VQGILCIVDTLWTIGAVDSSSAGWSNATDIRYKLLRDMQVECSTILGNQLLWKQNVRVIRTKGAL
jgi:hypothetical protein